MCNVVVGSQSTNQKSSSQRKLMLVSIWKLFYYYYWAVFNTRFSKSFQQFWTPLAITAAVEFCAIFAHVLLAVCAMLYCTACAMQYCAVFIAKLGARSIAKPDFAVLSWFLHCFAVCAIQFCTSGLQYCVHYNTVQYIAHAIDIT